MAVSIESIKRRLDPHPGTGTYVLVLYLGKEKTIRVGRLGGRLFRAGYYAYVGSALGPGGLTARLKHHISVTRKPRWHLDYLRRVTVPKEVWLLAQNDRRECPWADVMTRLDDTADPVPRFGCSDCRCLAHLFYYKRRPGFHRFDTLARKRFPDDGHIVRVRFDAR